MVVPVGRLGVVALSAARSTHQQALGGRTGTIGSMHRQRKKESPAGAGLGVMGTKGVPAGRARGKNIPSLVRPIDQVTRCHHPTDKTDSTSTS